LDKFILIESLVNEKVTEFQILFFVQLGELIEATIVVVNFDFKAIKQLGHSVGGDDRKEL
jgi:hypothetical protein